MKNLTVNQSGTDLPNEISGSATPLDLLIQSRNRHFSGAEIENRHWVGGDPIGTAFYNALSVTFPRGERFFMDVLRGFRDRAPQKLRREITAFIHQEAVHSREHACFNQQLTDSDYDLSKLEQTMNNVMDRIAGLPEIDQLAATACLEHITAIIAKELIANPAHLEHADEEQRKMWLWHASEEIEHKGVAYDTWLHATHDWSRWQRWKKKTFFMLKISQGFTKNRIKGMLELLRQDGITGLRAWTGVLHYALIGPAPFRRTMLSWFQFFKPGFHPWDIDDRYLIQLAESEYEAAILDQPEKHDNVTAIKERRKSERLRKVA